MSEQTPTEHPEPEGQDATAFLRNILSLLDRGLRPQSRFHIETADRAAEVNVGGEVLITLPRSPKDLVEVRYLGGKFRMLVD